MESRAACTVQTCFIEYPDGFGFEDMKNAFIGTACGLTFTGGRKFFKAYRAAPAAQHTPGIP